MGHPLCVSFGSPTVCLPWDLSKSVGRARLQGSFAIARALFDSSFLAGQGSFAIIGALFEGPFWRDRALLILSGRFSRALFGLTGLFCYYQGAFGELFLA